MVVRLNVVDLRRMLRILILGTAFLITTWESRGVEAGQAPAFSREQLEFYQKQIQPILAENCFKCHSHQAEKIKANLVLDSFEGLLRGGDSGQAVVPGNPDTSLLIRAVRQIDDDLKMPPKKRLSDQQIQLLAKWVQMGAPAPQNVAAAETKGRRATTRDTNWWAFQPLREVRVPEVNDGGWGRNPIDHFV